MGTLNTLNTLIEVGKVKNIKLEFNDSFISLNKRTLLLNPVKEVKLSDIKSRKDSMINTLFRLYTIGREMIREIGIKKIKYFNIEKVKGLKKNTNGEKGRKCNYLQKDASKFLFQENWKYGKIGVSNEVYGSETETVISLEKGVLRDQILFKALYLIHEELKENKDKTRLIELTNIVKTRLLK